MGPVVNEQRKAEELSIKKLPQTDTEVLISYLRVHQQQKPHSPVALASQDRDLLLSYIAKLVSDSATGARDTDRLNYIEENFHVLGFTRGSRVWFPVSAHDLREFRSLREVLDAVRISRGKPRT